MLSRSLKLLTAIATCATLAAALPDANADSGRGGRGGRGNGGNQRAVLGKVEGRITAIAGNRVTITNLRGQGISVVVTALTKIERNNRHVPLMALRIGDRGQALFSAQTGIASKIESVGPA